jgi:RHS repeat-associated protein
VSANADLAGSSTYHCPTWQPGWAVTPPSPLSLYSTTPTASQANNVSTAFFNADGVAVQSTNPDVQTSLSVADADGRTYCTSDPVNVASWLTANPSGTYPYLCPSTPPTTAPTSTTGYITTIFDHVGRTLSSTDQLGDTTTYTYDPSGHVATTTDPRSKVTTNCYYWQSGTGQCAASAPAAGGSLDALYSQTTPSTSADPSGETTTNTYLPGDTTYVTTTPSGTTTDSYDASLDLTGVAYSATASGYTTPANQSYTYFADGTRHTMTDASGTTTYTEDTNGDVTQQQFAAGTGTSLSNNTVGYGYFTTGVQSSVTYPTYGSHTSPQATYTYDALGNMASVTDWLGNEVTFAHDGNGNLTAQDNAVSTSNPTGTSNTAFSYDNADLNTQASSTLNCSGSNGTLTQSFGGSGGSRNANGQVTQDSEAYAGSCAGPTTYQRNYSYDQAGRVVYQGSTAQGASPNNIIYDAAGDPTQISNHDASGNFDSYTQVFDNAGETTSQTPISGSMGSSSSYSYDTIGDRTTTATGSATTTYGFNQAGQMASTSANATSYLYTGDGLEAASKTPGWGAATNIDGTTAINSVSCAATTFCVAIDASGNAFNYNGTSWSTANSIDGTNVLNSVSCATTSFCAAVDSNGNVLTYNGTTWSSASNIDGTTAIDSVSCASTTFCEAVDADGNALSYNGTSWSSATNIDSTKTLDSVTCVSITVCVAVDNSGNALWYQSGTTVNSQFIWNTNGSLAVALSDGTNDYLYGPTDQPVEQVNTTSSPPTNDPTFMTYTPSDSSWLITNASGAQTNFYRYDAFGNLAHGTSGSPFGYAGQYQDSSTGASGFDNMRARWFDSQTGSFTTRDPAFSQTDQAYPYSGGDPVNTTDPSGLDFSLCVGPFCTPNLHWQFQPGNIPKGAANLAAGAANTVIGLANSSNPGGPQYGYLSTYQGGCDSLLGISTFIGALIPGIATIPVGAEGLASDLSIDAASAVTGESAAGALPAFSQSTIDEGIASVASPFNKSISVGQRALEKKLGQGASAFRGIQPTTENAEAIVLSILRSPTRTVSGSETYDVYNAAGQGARFNISDNSFVGFLDASIASR